jgi:hypothetical protein
MSKWISKGGTAISEEAADGLADEAEIGYDIGPTTRGRPSLTGDSQPSPQITFRVAPETRDAVVARAERDHTTVSEIARRALERYLAS